MFSRSQNQPIMLVGLLHSMTQRDDIAEARSSYFSLRLTVDYRFLAACSAVILCSYVHRSLVNKSATFFFTMLKKYFRAVLNENATASAGEAYSGL